MSALSAMEPGRSSPVLVSSILSLEARAQARIPATTGYDAFSCFLGILGATDPLLATRLHEHRSDKPFTVSPLLGSTRSQGGTIEVYKGARCWLRLTSSDEALSGYLESCTDLPSAVRLGGASFAVLGVSADRSGVEGARRATFEELFRHWMTTPSESLRTIAMDFQTPTTFRSFGTNLPLPLPGFVFRGLYEKWRAFAPAELAAAIEVHLRDLLGADPGRAGEALHWRQLDSLMPPKQYELRTQMLDFRNKRMKQVGFLGRVNYDARRIGEGPKRALHLLADYAFFAGVGYLTTWGMGQVRPIPV